MADVVETVISQTAENLTKNANVTGKIPATPEGMAIAYGSLIIMAVVPIFFGSYRSVRHHKEQRVCYCFAFYLILRVLYPNLQILFLKANFLFYRLRNNSLFNKFL